MKSTQQEKQLYKKRIDNNDKMQVYIGKYWPVKEAPEGKDFLGLELEKNLPSPKAKVK